MAKFYTNTQFQSSVQLESTVMNAMDARIQAGFQLISQALSDMGSGDYVLDNPDSTTELKVVASTPADMRVHVSTGVASVSGLLCQNEATKSLRITSPTTNNRYTIVQISYYGEISTVNGVEAGSPVEPSADADNMKLCAIYLPQSTTKIENTDGGFGYIIDRRVLWGYGFSQVGDNYGFGTTTPDRRVDILDTTGPQLRLTYTDNTIYGDLKVDSNGYFSLVSTGKRYGLNTTSPSTMLEIYDAPDVDLVTFYGVGLDDLSTSIAVSYDAHVDRYIDVVIDGTGATDTFKWGYYANELKESEYFLANNIPITGGWQALFTGISIKFASITGHTLTDAWDIDITATDGIIKCQGINIGSSGTITASLRCPDTNVFLGAYVAHWPGFRGLYNTSGGDYSMQTAYDANYNVAWGYHALDNVQSGRENTAIGPYTLTSPNINSNTAVGYEAGRFASGSNSVYVGLKAGKNATGDYQLYVDASDTATPLIWGNFDTNLLTVHGSLGIGTKTPTALLHLIAGTIAAGTSPLKLTSGPVLTTPEAGAIEFLTDAFYATISTGPARKTLAFLESPVFTTPNIGVATATSIAIGANVLDTNEWAFLDSQDQGVKIASTPRFARLGLGVAADTTIPLKSLHASSPQMQLTNVDGSVFVDLKANTNGNLDFMPSGGNLNIVVTDGSVVTYDDEVVLVY